jgi:phospholipase C
MPENFTLTVRSLMQRTVITLLVYILATSVLAAPSLKQQATISAASQAITVMTYNIQQLGYPNWIADHFEKQRLELIPETIKTFAPRPDVLVLQEVFTQYSYDFLLSTLSEIYPYHTQVVGEDCKDPRWSSISGNCRFSLIKGNSGLLIFSRWPIEQQHAYVFDAVRVSKTFDFLARKGVVYAKIEVTQNNSNQLAEPMMLHVFGTHLQASAEEHDIRLLQLDEMRRFIDGFKIPKDQAVILAGDFNISSIDQSGFNDMLVHAMAVVTSEEGGVGSISDSTNQYRRLLAATDAEIKPDLTLDYVLYRSDHLQPINKPKLQVIDFKSSSAWRGARLFKPDVELNDLSDHYPAMMQFEFSFSD